MNLVDDTLKQLGDHFGMEELHFNRNGSALLRLESGQEFGFERKKDSVIIFGSIPLSYNLANQTLTAFKQAHVNKIQDNLLIANLPFQVFIRNIEQNDSLAIAIHIQNNEFTANRAIQIMDAIQKWLAETV